MIVASRYEIDNHTQQGGWRWVKEIHTDSAGNEHIIRYLTDDLSVVDSKLQTRMFQLDEMLVEKETDDCVSAVLNGADLLSMTFADTDRQTVARKLFREVAANPNPKAVLAITPLMTALHYLHPTEQEQADYLGITLETMQSANERFSRLTEIQSVLVADSPIEVPNGE